MNEQDLERDVERLVAAAQAAEITLKRHQIVTELRQAPHERPRNLPHGKVAVYAWFFGDQCLKCGKAWRKTVQRYTYQHYKAGSANSTLANSLIKSGRRIGIEGLTAETAGAWLQENTTRIDLLFPVDIMSPFALAYYEAFFHVRWKPVFEGPELTAW